MSKSPMKPIKDISCADCKNDLSFSYYTCSCNRNFCNDCIQARLSNPKNCICNESISNMKMMKLNNINSENCPNQCINGNVCCTIELDSTKILLPEINGCAPSNLKAEKLSNPISIKDDKPIESPNQEIKSSVSVQEITGKPLELPSKYNFNPIKNDDIIGKKEINDLQINESPFLGKNNEICIGTGFLNNPFDHTYDKGRSPSGFREEKKCFANEYDNRNIDDENNLLTPDKTPKNVIDPPEEKFLGKVKFEEQFPLKDPQRSNEKGNMDVGTVLSNKNDLMNPLMLLIMKKLDFFFQEKVESIEKSMMIEMKEHIDAKISPLFDEVSRISSFIDKQVSNSSIQIIVRQELDTLQGTIVSTNNKLAALENNMEKLSTLQNSIENILQDSLNDVISYMRQTHESVLPEINTSLEKMNQLETSVNNMKTERLQPLAANLETKMTNCKAANLNSLKTILTQFSDSFKQNFQSIKDSLEKVKVTTDIHTNLIKEKISRNMNDNIVSEFKSINKKISNLETTLNLNLNKLGFLIDPYSYDSINFLSRNHVTRNTNYGTFFDEGRMIQEQVSSNNFYIFYFDVAKDYIHVKNLKNNMSFQTYCDKNSNEVVAEFHQNKIYIIRFLLQSSLFRNQLTVCKILDLSSREIEEFKMTESKCSGVSLVSTKNFICCLGGRNHNGYYLNTFEYFDNTNKKFDKGKPLNNYDCCICVAYDLNSFIYTFGGLKSKFFQRFNLRSMGNQWESLQIEFNYDFYRRRISFSLNDKEFILFGESCSSSLIDPSPLYLFNTSTNELIKLPQLYVQKFSATRAVYFKGYAYILHNFSPLLMKLDLQTLENGIEKISEF